MKVMFSILVVIIHNTVKWCVCGRAKRLVIMCPARLEHTPSGFSTWPNFMKYLRAVWPTLLVCFVHYVRVRICV